MQEQGGSVMTVSLAVQWVSRLGVSQVVQANINPHLCFAWVMLPEPQSNLRWLLLVVGLEIPR